MYQHHWFSEESADSAVDLPVGKVVCVGRNYAEHARELNNPIPTDPILFIKPATAITPLEEDLVFAPELGDVHYEVEIAILIGQTMKNVSEAEAANGIVGLGVALDLTLRDLQSKLKEKGHPWEKAKAFDGASPLSGFLKYTGQNLNDIPVKLTIDGDVRQDGSSAQMLFGIPALLSYISKYFTLQPGDVVLTGTPAGVGKLESGMELKAELPGLVTATTKVV
ncbi:fumarylacetoacetate hydrolase family protein [Parendozoicomonas haliclonae]|uniref:Ureidoglycolate lyase n=1 Tax=Parendozoicomonas haliclonae TaxID=1960125 RepID=A0A1X7AIX9_9GAMM|nr:fumarylacetoacetate hydrolase family protein [Parendozoicomonas haliclonae]SMA45904.1 Ureidoglycolate lyase [Parendozoicomonas haliclonae]